MDAGSGPIGIAWDTWRAQRGGPEGIARRQHARLAELVEFARSASPYYRGLYRDVPDDITDPRQLPRVGKRELMANFDDWVTDPHITLARLRSELLASAGHWSGLWNCGRFCATACGPRPWSREAATSRAWS